MLTGGLRNADLANDRTEKPAIDGWTKPHQAAADWEGAGVIMGDVVKGDVALKVQ